MMNNYRIGDIVMVDIQEVANNNANLDIDQASLFTIIDVFRNGETMYRIRNTETDEKVFIREDEEYAFIGEELDMVCEKEAYS